MRITAQVPRHLIIVFLASVIVPTALADEATKRRVILDADTANEIDDCYAIVRALLAPEFAVEGLCSEPFGLNPPPESIEASQMINEEILSLLGLSERIPAALGADRPMADKNTPVESPAARLIIQRARAGGADNKLWVIATGQCTNLASALLLDPTIKDKVVFAFIDGDFKNNHWGPGICNWRNDIHAVQAIFESEVEYFHMPAPSVSNQLKIVKSEAERHLKGRGGIHDYLLERWNAFAPRRHLWTMWDIALVEAIIRPQTATAKIVGAPIVSDLWRVKQFPDNPRRVSVWVDIDEKQMLTDFWRTLDQHAREKPASISKLPDPETVEAFAPRSIPPLDGCAWLGQDGIRAAWLGYKQVDDEMVDHLLRARVNAVFLSHGFHDLLLLETARWDGDRLVVEANERTMQRLAENTSRAARRGIHVFWLANYELEQMLPHLKRLGYQPAFAEGPSRFLRPGPQQDAAPLDPVFWRGITGAHGELVAQLSRKHAIDGLLYDTEHYAGGMMYLQNCGFSDATFKAYLLSRQLTVDAVPAGKRYDFLKVSGQLQDYYHFLEEQAYEQGRDLANRWHAINPHLVLGIWPLLDNWFAQGFLRGLSGAVPSLGLSGVEYYHGSDQTRSLAEFFQSRNANLIYMPGFYPPYAYSVDQLERHVAQAIRTTNNYWMLGPHEELRRPEYQAALHDAFEFATPPSAVDVPAVNLHYRVEQDIGGPMLIVDMDGAKPLETPLLSLWSTFGGAPLCDKRPMKLTEGGAHQARISLLRRITNNRHMSDGFRSGVTYKLNPSPLEFQYEDPHHVKLIDGRAYGFFGTTVAWPGSLDRASVSFDLHRDYRIVRVEAAQPTKLEDRNGGPTQLRLHIGRQPETREHSQLFEADFPVTGKDYSEPDTPANDPNDPRHGRAWLSWKVDLPEAPARWLRIEMQRTRKNSSISLGEVVLWAVFDGEVQAGVQSAGRILSINRGQRWTVEGGN